MTCKEVSDMLNHPYITVYKWGVKHKVKAVKIRFNFVMDFSESDVAALKEYIATLPKREYNIKKSSRRREKTQRREQILECVKNAGDKGITAPEIAKIIGVTNSHITNMIKRMIETNYPIFDERKGKSNRTRYYFDKVEG